MGRFVKSFTSFGQAMLVPVILFAAAVSDPLHWLNALGITTGSPDWVYPPIWRQSICFALCLIWLFFWYHRQRIAFEDRQPDRPSMSLPMLIRYLGWKSQWAANRSRSNDDDWIKDILIEIRRALLRKELNGYGICERRHDGLRDKGSSKIPLEFWQEAEFDPLAAYDVSCEVVVGATAMNFPFYSAVRFDPEKVGLVWPSRNLWAAFRKKSPAERTGIDKMWKNDASK